MKTLDEFVALFAEQFEETDASEFQASTVFHDLDEWSSLIGLSVIAMVDEEFDVALKGDDVKNSVTVEDLYNREIVAWKIGDSPDSYLCIETVRLLAESVSGYGIIYY